MPRFLRNRKISVARLGSVWQTGIVVWDRGCRNISDFLDDPTEELIEPVRPRAQRGFENPRLGAAD